MKTALCFTGTGRSIEHTFEHLKEFVIDPLGEDCDVFVYIADTPKAKTTEKYFSDFSHRIDVVKEEYTDPNGSGFVFVGPEWPPAHLDRDKGRDIYLKMVKSRKYMMDMVDSSTVDYDRVIFSRMDVMYERKITESIADLDMNYLWLPSFHHWNIPELGRGYNDRFAISNQDNMRKYMSQWVYMEHYRNEGLVFHAECTLKHHLDRQKIKPKIFKCNFVRIRPDGQPHETFESIQVDTKPCDI